MNWIPFVLLIVLSACGLASRRFLPMATTYSVLGKVAVLGHFAMGLLLAWIASCLVRGLFLVVAAPSWQASDIIYSPLRIFYVEGWILLGMVLVEVWFLKGHYELRSECTTTIGIGTRQATLFVLSTTMVAIPVWWFICPGERDLFEGTLFHGLVHTRAFEMFDANLINAVSVDGFIWSQYASAIPEAFVIAAVLVSLAPVLRHSYSYFKFILNDEYVHLPPVKKNEEAMPHLFPTPRGRKVR